ncbi:MAG: class I SAM-dependent methyltransferase [Candidatus Pacebacteria bacterium]|nr:class I SAM-dependent methyltransferase [Candidatus Paceibacterota bacterium]
MPGEYKSYSAKFEPFERHADRYDAWFDSERGRRVFPLEVQCLKDVLDGLPRPWLEIGVGTGRFAAALGIPHGIDPSTEAIKYAERRGIQVERGFAEKLPYKAGSYATIAMIVTVCFLAEPSKAFAECARVLRPKGSLVVGLVPKHSPWGQLYARKGQQGHPFYLPATFYSCREVVALAERHGMTFIQAQSCLVEQPDKELHDLQPPKPGMHENAGFVGMHFMKQ